jgi:hypothetical protein
VFEIVIDNMYCSLAVKGVKYEDRHFINYMLKATFQSVKTKFTIAAPLFDACTHYNNVSCRPAALYGLSLKIL